MSKFTLIAEDDFSGKRVTYEFEEEYIEDVLSGFEDFLKGAGYEIDGLLKIEKNTPSIWDTYPKTNESAIFNLSDINVDLTENNTPFSSMIDDHLTMLDNYDNVMNIDLSGIEAKTSCGNCDCGTGCGKNAN